MADRQWYDDRIQIGGRDLDVGQIAASIAVKVRETWPINGVPVEVAMAVTVLQGECDAVEAIQAIHARPLPDSLRRHLCREAIRWELRELARLHPDR